MESKILQNNNKYRITTVLNVEIDIISQFIDTG